MSYYVYPDGTITEEPLSFMSDDLMKYARDVERK